MLIPGLAIMLGAEGKRRLLGRFVAAGSDAQLDFKRGNNVIAFTLAD